MRGRVTVLSLALFACNQSDFGDGPSGPEPNPEGPGTPAWGEEDVSCEESSDCHHGEVCEGGICVMQRCADVDKYESIAPIGERRYFFRDREIVLADSTTYEGEYWVDGYASEGSSLVYPSGGGSWKIGGTSVIDVAGGNLLGTRPEVVAAAVEGSNQVIIPAGGTSVSLPFAPVAIAAGDVDNDGTDDLAAISATGDIAVCFVAAGTCSEAYFDNVTGIDVAVGDVDGDHFAEPVFLIDADGTHQLIAWNHDAELTGQEASVGTIPGYDFFAITAGDLNGDGRAELLALEDGGYAGFVDDGAYIYTFGGTGFGLLGETDVEGDSLDVTTADLDHDRVDEILILRNDPVIEVYRAPEATTLSLYWSSTPSVSSSPFRITSVDFDGDSPAGRLVEGPTLVPGKVVPTTVLYMPPYYQSRSASAPWLWLGDQQNMTESLSDTVALRVGVTIGVDAEFPAIAEVELTSTLSQELTATTTYEKTITIGDQFYLEVDPELYGEDYAAVVLSCGCFHSYVYEMEDPADQMGGNGGRFVILVPVGGHTTMWSTKRYNAMAERVGDLPTIAVPHRVGDPHSYAETPQRADGSSVPADDMVFPVVPSIRVSDVGDIGFGLIIGQQVTNEIALQTNLDVEGSVTVTGFKLGGQVGVGWGQGYAVGLGTTADFIGAVPALPDDPTTPEDEYATYAYAFSPMVYRQKWTDAQGNEAAYYVLNYMVAF